jgi:hypothetical protein
MRIYLVALAIIPVWSFAAGYGGAEGRNRLGERIYIASDSYYDLYVIRGPSESDWSKPFDMDTNCPGFSNAMNKGPGATFSCPPKPAFPLSGTTYRITTSRKYRPCSSEPFNDNSPGTVYECVKGCNSKTAPAIFNESPWECN